MTKLSHEQKCIQILNDCRTPRTMHFIKDRYNFSSEQLKNTLGILLFAGYLLIRTVPKDGRGTKAITTTDKGREYLILNGVKY